MTKNYCATAGYFTSTWALQSAGKLWQRIFALRLGDISQRHEPSSRLVNYDKGLLRYGWMIFHLDMKPAVDWLDMLRNGKGKHYTKTRSARPRITTPLEWKYAEGSTSPLFTLLMHVWIKTYCIALCTQVY